MEKIFRIGFPLTGAMAVLLVAVKAIANIDKIETAANLSTSEPMNMLFIGCALIAFSVWLKSYQSTK